MTFRGAVRAIICAEAAYIVVVALLIPQRSDVSTAPRILPYVAAIAIAAAILYMLRLSDRTQLMLVVATVPAALVLLPLECYLGSPAKRFAGAYAKRAQLPILQSEHGPVYPLLAPWDLAYGKRTLGIGENAGLPLTGMSSVPTGLCEQDGRELVYESDVHGFRNPASADSLGQIDVALVGDSFAQGYCVTSSESLSGRIATAFPRSMSFGVTGAGPLWELAVLREYAAQHRPRVVVWLFYEGNDLATIPLERAGFTGNYLNPGFTQRLSLRQAEVDRALRHRADSLTRSFTGYKVESLRRLLLFREIRSRLSLSVRPPEGALPPPGVPVDGSVPDLARVIDLAASATAEWNGRLIFVYLPDRDRFMKPGASNPLDAHAMRNRILADMRSRGITAFDATRIFEAERDPLSLFDGAREHYNGRGYATVADSVVAVLRRIGIDPATSGKLSLAAREQWLHLSLQR